MPAKPKPIDWVSVELEYRAGLMTLKDIGSRYGVSDVGIIKRARQYGWTRSLQAKIEQERENRLNVVMAQVKQAEGAVISYPLERQTIEINAQMQADIILSHRRDINSLRLTVAEMANDLGDLGDRRIKLFVDSIRAGSLKAGDEVKVLAGALEAAIALPQRSSIAVKLVTALSTLVDKERQAFGIDKGETSARSLGEVLDSL
jgi:hypothetical protein